MHIRVPLQRFGDGSGGWAKEFVMIMGMTDAQATDFLERISATTIVNQAVLKCQLCRQPVTIDTVIYFIGDFFDPADEDRAGLVLQIRKAIEDVVSVVPPKVVFAS
jgi:hypothetical protein